MARFSARLFPLLIIAACSGSTSSAQTIQDVHVLQAVPTSSGDVSFYLEITGRDFPAAADLRVFVAPQEGISVQPQVVSGTDSQIVAKFTATKDYFPATVGVAGAKGTVSVFDVDKKANPHSTDPRIDDVEILQLNRAVGTGSIKIDGANFGSDASKLAVSIVPHNPALSVFGPVPPPKPYACPEPTPQQLATPPKIRDARDNVVIVDFSFSCTYGYSGAFRIASVTLIRADAVNGRSVAASYDTAPPQSRDLTYRYTILSQAQARSRFGGGISENFYAVQLSIVNQGTAKIQIPLASIQAEVQSGAGSAGKKFYLEEPVTVAPVPLAGAVSYFSTYRQSSGLRAKAFNILQGLTTIGSAVQFLFGHGFAQGVAIAGGGFRQGLGQIWQDMSDQQLANLTSQSFETIETVSGNGGSIEKVIFIQRGEELMVPEFGYKFVRRVTNITGFEITGYEVPQTPTKAATPKP